VKRNSKPRPATLLLALWGIFARQGLWGQEQRIPGPGDFGATLEISGREGSLMILELPETVYRRAERQDLGDLRVFDSDGAPVPFLIVPPAPVQYTPPPLELPFFIWKENAPPREADIEINAAGTVIRITGSGISGTAETGTASGEREGPESYILDLHELFPVPASLSLNFEEGNFSCQAELFFARKLGDWRGAGVQPLARYSSSDGSRVERTVLELPEAESSYLLISIRGNAPRLKTVTAEFKSIEMPGKIRESRVQGRLSENNREAFFDAGAFYPLRSVDFTPGGPDFLNVEISSRFRENESWHYETSGLLYMFTSEGRVHRNKPFTLVSPAPFWRLVLRGEVSFASPPELILQWEAKELVFLGKGRGPWTLAYGNANIGPPPDTLASGAIQGELFEAWVSGEEQYRGRQGETAPKTDYQPWLLWGSLAASALVLTGLAVYTGRSMLKQKEK
jgi:hypothetical protein